MRLNGRGWGQMDGVRVIRPPEPDRPRPWPVRVFDATLVVFGVALTASMTVVMVALAVFVAVKVWREVAGGL